MLSTVVAQSVGRRIFWVVVVRGVAAGVGRAGGRGRGVRKREGGGVHGGELWSATEPPLTTVCRPSGCLSGCLSGWLAGCPSGCLGRRAGGPALWSCSGGTVENSATHRLYAAPRGHLVERTPLELISVWRGREGQCDVILGLRAASSWWWCCSAALCVLLSLSRCGLDGR